MTDALVIFAKYPEPGRVKTRLAATLGPEEACRVYERILKSVLDHHRGRAYDLVTFLTPGNRAADFSRRFDVRVEEQRGEDLGARLSDCFERMCASYDRVAVGGSDIPGLSQERVLEAFDALRTADVAIGPCPDGGYYLVASRRPVPIFADIPWSTREVLSRTLLLAASLGLRAALLGEENDVDDINDLK